MNLKKLKVWAAASKWRKHQILSNSSFIQPFLPETAELNQYALEEYLEKYDMVYLKPVYGSGGHGIIKLSKLKRGYELKTIRSSKGYRQKHALFKAIKQITGGKPYIIQQGIDLLTIEGNPIDFRILILKPADRWEVMGIMGKLGRRNKIVTNYCQGAKAIPLQIALERSNMEIKDVKEIEDLLSVLGIEVAKLVSSRYKYVREIGLDVAIDSNEKVWIIEANTRPNFKLFKYHPDRSLYPKIYRYIKHIRFKKTTQGVPIKARI